MLGIKNLTEEEYLSYGSIACPGCGAILSLRLALKGLGKNTIVINATSCLAVTMQMGVPKVLYWHVLFENAPAIASGIDAYLQLTGKRDKINLLVICGDGATADIGLSALSGAIERNQRLIYISYDNESYMNTGGQRSSTTPYGAATTTTPVGKIIKGEEHPMSLVKDVAEIMIAQGCEYVATASIAYPIDYINKVVKASKVKGPSYIQVHTPCPTGWGFEEKDTIKLARLAVQTRYVILYEFENGKRKLSMDVKKPKPIKEYICHQRRFAHLSNEDIEKIQFYIDEKYRRLVGG
ncbi:MAG: thiamine pyrophosphate-dependent enzyme [Candidatus Thermoplasmatota archaeon]